MPMTKDYQGRWWPSAPIPPKPQPSKKTEPTTTIELLDYALEGGDSARELARKIGLGDNTLNMARHRGRLSPTAAGTLASHVGKDPILWTAIAAVEAEPASPQKTSLTSQILKSIKAQMHSHML